MIKVIKNFIYATKTLISFYKCRHRFTFVDFGKPFKREDHESYILKCNHCERKLIANDKIMGSLIKMEALDTLTKIAYNSRI